MNNTKLIACEKCGGKTFNSVFFLVRISKLMAGTTEDVIKPLQTFKCDNCGNINKEFTVPEDEEKKSNIIA